MHMNKPLNIAIAGLGTVGGGTFKILQENAGLLEARCGRAIHIVAVSARDKNKKRAINIAEVKWVDSPADLLTLPDVDVIVELIGGSEGVAKLLVEEAFKAGKHVVTANKALIAHHGLSLAKLAEAKGAAFGYEAAVAGGIPVIKTLREGLTANRFHAITGILNGTCNFILTSMMESGQDFATALAQAQHIGYAEADPSFDIDGIDTAHKLTILTSLAYGCPPDIHAVKIEGIRHITARDIVFADKLGYVIKLLGISTRTEQGILQRVHPCMVSKLSTIGRVAGAYNGIIIEGSSVGRLTLEGQGAGEGPTASSVISDIADIARGIICKPFGIPVAAIADIPRVPIDTLRTSYYVRLAVIDKPGVLASITAIFSEENISLREFQQYPQGNDQPVQVVLITHETLEFAMLKALESVSKLNSVLEPAHMIRIEAL